MKDLGEIKRCELREVWPHEAQDFTPWLAENIDRLSEALGMDLELQQTEAGVGGFSLDLLARDLGSGRNVIIENQLTATDHDHLGKLLTYAAGFDAHAVIWVAQEVREEHRQAIEWLNQRTDSDTNLFVVTVEVIQIDESRPACNFKLIVSPNEWQKRRRRSVGQEVTEKGEAYQRFFTDLVDSLRDEHRFTRATKVYPQNWYSFSAGVTGVVYGASFARGNRVRVDIYIGTSDPDRNQQIFDHLRSMKDRLETDFGESFEWERLDERKGSRIAIYREGSIVTSSEELQEIRDWMIDRLVRLKGVLDGPVRSVPEEAKQV